MTKTETLVVTLSEPLALEIKRAVEKGGYSAPGDVVAAALNDWVERGSPPAMTTERLRELIDEAERAGEEEGEFDIEAILAEARDAKDQR
jgi:Arc/MetJ-type ribon-helix-helix transcriptional regulator